MEWKQPIPTSIEGLSRQERSVLQHILLRCANEERYISVNGVSIKLQRGECILGRFEFAEEFLLKRKESLRVYRIITRLEKVNKQIRTRKSRDCSIVTVLKYEELISMGEMDEQSMNNQRTISEQSMNTNKNDKSVENVNITTTSLFEDIEFKDKMYKTYKHLTQEQIDSAFNKMQGWLLSNPKRKGTKKFITTWLNREKIADTKETTVAGIMGDLNLPVGEGEY